MTKDSIGFCCVAVGEPWDGIRLFGPFHNNEEAEEWAEDCVETWSVVPILAKDGSLEAEDNGE